MRFIYEQPGGGIAICMAASKENLEQVLGPMSDESYRAHVLDKSVPPGVKNVFILADDWRPPQSRHFRNAWKLDGGQILVDMPTARNIQRNAIRAERAAQWVDFDIAAMRALSRRDVAEVDAIEAAKQKLRDAPAHPAIEAAATPEQLAAITLADVMA